MDKTELLAFGEHHFLGEGGSSSISGVLGSTKSNLEIG